MRLSARFAALAAFAASAVALPFASNTTLAVRQDAGPKVVLAHFMLGIVYSYTAQDWEDDIRQAMAIGIDGFALNAGRDEYTGHQLELAYAAAQNVGGGKFKMIISFDFTSYDVNDVGAVADVLRKYGNHDAQLKVNGQTFVSTFYGEGFHFREAEAQAGVSLFSCPAWGPDPLGSADADCGFQWNSWPSENNQPVKGPLTLDGDKWWQKALGGKPYMAGVSPWFFTHYGTDTWDKNWIFESDTLWTDRWQSLLELQPQFIEIITWNDYGESHYIGPLRDEKQDIYAGGPTGATKWVPGHDHSAWATVAAPYIAAYKAGSKAPLVTSEHLVYYHRQQSRDLTCSDPVPAPNGAQLMADSVFATILALEPGAVIITSGGNSPVSIEVQAGVSTVSAPMGVGKQTFAFVRNGATILSGDSYREVRASCDVYDFNPFVGELSGSSSSSPPASTQEPIPAPAEPTPAPAPADPAPVPSTPSDVVFTAEHETVWGENVYVTGNTEALGSWDPARAILLNTDESTYPSWTVTVPITGEYEFKYIVKNPAGEVIWTSE